MLWPLYPQERAPGTDRLGGWVGPRASLDSSEEGGLVQGPVQTVQGRVGWFKCQSGHFRERWVGPRACLDSSEKEKTLDPAGDGITISLLSSLWPSGPTLSCPSFFAL
jgi:hypothetical protein